MPVVNLDYTTLTVRIVITVPPPCRLFSRWVFLRGIRDWTQVKIGFSRIGKRWKGVWSVVQICFHQFFMKRHRVLFLCQSLSLFYFETNSFKSQWLIIYRGNEMPKPREAHYQGRKGHSHPAHRYAFLETHTHTQTTVMNGNDVFIWASSRRSFILATNHSQGQSKNLTDEAKSAWRLRKIFSLKLIVVGEVVTSDQQHSLNLKPLLDEQK